MILLLGCSARHADRHVEKESSIYNMTRFVQGIHAFPYDAPADKSQRLSQSVPLIIKGMMKTEIETMLGKPNGIRTSMAKWVLAMRWIQLVELQGTHVSFEAGHGALQQTTAGQHSGHVCGQTGTIQLLASA